MRPPRARIARKASTAWPARCVISVKTNSTSPSKKDSRDRILQGPPFTATEDDEHLDYCADDTLALARLLPHLVSLTPSLKHAYLRAEVQWGIAWQEWRGVPMNLPKLTELRARWVDIQADLVRDMDAPFGCYEFDDQGAPHWRKALFADLVDRHRLSWPTLESGALDEADSTFRDMCARYPFLEPLRELRYTHIQAPAQFPDGRERR